MCSTAPTRTAPTGSAPTRITNRPKAARRSQRPPPLTLRAKAAAMAVAGAAAVKPAWPGDKRAIVNSPANITDPLVLFMPSGKRGRFPVGTPVLDAARQLGVYVESVCGGRAT